MSKVKFNFSAILGIVKQTFLGVVFTLIGTIIFAIVLKYVDLDAIVIDYINNGIKGLSIYLMVLMANKKMTGGLLARSCVLGSFYGVISFLIFSLLNGSINFDMIFVSDTIFATVVAIVSSIIVNLFRKRT